jgi:DNA polymerase (family X)
LALLAMIRGDSSESARLTRAIAFVREFQLTSDAALGPFFESPPKNADADVIKLLRQMHEAGGWVLVESMLADLPADLRWLYENGAVTLEQLGAIHRVFGATSSADLAAALQEGSLGRAGLDAAAQDGIVKALPHVRSAIKRIPLGRAMALAEPFLVRLQSVPGVLWSAPAGSLRRGEDNVGDIEIVAATTNPGEAIEAVLADSDIVRTLHRSERRVYALIDRVQVGVVLPEPSTAAGTLLYRTGSIRHVEEVRARAAAKQLTLTATGLRDAAGRPIEGYTEEALYAAIGLAFIPPELRDDGEEFLAADRGTLPQLVSRDDIRGDLHMHSQWSDGRDPIEAMVQGCAALGYEYMAITDHSQTSAATRNLTIDGVKKQADEIAALRAQYPQIAILHGCEVDILPDGRLDFPDNILERFDIVLASLHERAGHSADRLLNRYAGAMQHPLVSMITHPTNRLVPYRPGYDLNYDRLFELAVETRTVLEIDGAPGHLDLNGVLARRAIAAGATVCVDSDCHRSDFLGRQMHLGLLTARRGWAEPRHVLNTRPLADVRAFIADKRNGR